MHPKAGPCLISDWDYTPTPGFGKWVKLALLDTLPPDTPQSSTPPPPSSARARGASSAIGIFESRADVGTVLHPGSVEYDAARRRYTVAGSGAHMWSTTDPLHFA